MLGKTYYNFVFGCQNQGVILVLFLTLLFVTKSLSFEFPITDVFHFGEFLAAATTILTDTSNNALPYTIHGGADFFPALFYDKITSTEDMTIAYTTLSYGFFSALAIVFVVLASLRYATIFKINTYLLIPFIVFAGHGIGWRDLFFSINLYLFTFIIQNSSQTYFKRTLLEVTFGAFVALGAYWSFDRGLASIAVFGFPLLVLAFKLRTHSIAILSFLVFFPLFGSTLPGTNLLHYVDNIGILLETASKWRYDLDAERISLILISIAVNISAFALCIRYLIIQRPKLNKVLLLTCLTLISLAFMKIGLNRIDFNHVKVSLWAPIFLLTLCASTQALPKPKISIINFIFIVLISYIGIYILSRSGYPELFFLAIAATLIALALLPYHLRSTAITIIAGLCFSAFVHTGKQIRYGLANEKYAWATSIPTLPSNSDVVPKGVRWAAEQLRLADANCVFDMVNNGLINTVAHLPACSQFTYPIYAGSQHETRLIADLRKRAPNAIVYRGDYWSYSIDGIDMTQRYPTLDKVLRSSYPVERCAHGYCIRSIR